MVKYHHVIRCDNGLFHTAVQCWIVHETLKTRKYNTQCHSQHTLS